MQVKNTDSLNYFLDNWGVVDEPTTYLTHTTQQTFLASFDQATVHTLPFLMTNNGRLVTEHVWPLMWKQKNKPKNHGIFTNWSDTVDITFNPVSKNFNEAEKYVWLPIDESSANNPWHIWIDIIGKIRLVETRLSKSYKDFVYIIPNESKYLARAIKDLNLDIRYIIMPKNEAWRFNQIYVPSMVNWKDGVIHPKTVGWLRSRFKSTTADQGQSRKIFIDRAGGSRQLTNKEEVFANLKGWEVLVLEDMSVDEQVSAFANASHVAGTHGAGLVNLLWCRPGTKVTEIVHKHTAKYVYPNLSHLCGLDHTVLHGEPVPILKDTRQKKFKRMNDYNDIKLDSSTLLRNLL